jgi:amidase
MDELVKKSATELARLIRARRVSTVEVAEAYLRQIEKLNPALNAIVTLAPDVLERAREAESAVMRGETVGTLHGVPITVKDTIETAGLRTTSGTRLRADYIPATDATAVRRLKDAGAIVIGKTNVPEMALTYECENPLMGRTVNPYDEGRTPGGSSGGEAAAAATCLSAAGLGSDLVGSIRIPAHFCGITGLKPTADPRRIPVDGHFPEIFERLERGGTFGPVARRVEDLSLLFDVLTRSDDVDAARDRNNLAGASGRPDLRGKRVACYASDGVIPVTRETVSAVCAAAEALSEAGLEMIDELPPSVERGPALWLELFGQSVRRQMRELFTGREECAGTAVRAMLGRVEVATNDDRQRYLKAIEECEMLRASLIEWMETTPLIIAPVGATPAFEHGARRVNVEGQSIGVFHAFGYSHTFNVFNLPAVTVPAGRTREGLPVGVQIVGRPYREREVLAAASIVEEALGGWQPVALSTEGHNPL